MSPNAPTMPGVGTSRIASPASRQSKLATLKTRTPGTTCSMETQKADRESPSLPAFRSWGTLSAPRFRSVLSHWFIAASWRDYTRMHGARQWPSPTCRRTLPYHSRAHGTSQRCVCGAPNPKTLSQRWHQCESCGLSVPRDHASALEILRLGLSLLGGTWPT